MTTTTTTNFTDVYMSPRLLAPGGTAADLSTHELRYGPLAYGDPDGLLRTVAESGLTGRGGAAFPMYRKLVAVADASRRTGRAPVVVANGAEGEPASRKDRTLLRLSPHLVLDGVQLAARATGAAEAHLAVEDGASFLESALAQRHDPLPVRIVRLPSRFLSGQASALAQYVSGNAPLPRHQRPPVRERGVRKAPTLVQNVETLAHLALVARYGADWFRGVGTLAQPGSTLCTLHAPGREVRVVEAPFGLPLNRLLPSHGVSAVLMGGYHGTWIPAGEASQRTLDANDLGAGVLAALPADRCGVAETARVLRYLALQSAGQCGPCLNGLPRIASAFRALATPGPPADARHDVARWSGLVEGRGACHHPDGTARLVRSALTTFAPELDAHARGLCTASDPTPFLPIPNEAR